MNMIQKAKEQVQELTKQAYAAAVKEGLLPEGVTVEPSVEIPKDASHGDYATSFAIFRMESSTCSGLTRRSLSTTRLSGTKNRSVLMLSVPGLQV